MGRGCSALPSPPSFRRSCGYERMGRDGRKACLACLPLSVAHVWSQSLSPTPSVLVVETGRRAASGQTKEPRSARLVLKGPMSWTGGLIRMLQPAKRPDSLTCTQGEQSWKERRVSKAERRGHTTRQEEPARHMGVYNSLVMGDGRSLSQSRGG